MKLPLRTVVWTLIAALFVLCATGCNTIEGAGEDIESAGEGIEDAAD